MKRITMMIVLALVATAPLPALAGRDQAQILSQGRANAKAAQRQAPAQAQSREARAAAGPAGQAAKEGTPSNQQLELLKRFHPKRAYG